MKREIKIALLVCGVLVLAVAVMLRARGSRDKVFEGIVGRGHEMSDFYPDGDCSISPYWLEAGGEASVDLQGRLAQMGNPQWVWVKFRDDLSSIGGIRSSQWILKRGPAEHNSGR